MKSREECSLRDADQINTGDDIRVQRTHMEI